MSFVFPSVKQARQESARNSFEFYRSEHLRKTGFDTDRVFSDDDYEFQWFVQDMKSAQQWFTEPAEDLAARYAQRQKLKEAVERGIARSVENAGRQAMIYAVESDDDLEPDLDDEPDKDPRDSELVSELKELLDDKPKKAKKSKKKGPKWKRRKVKGWARVATGEKTCSWCLMLCSRGPVYSDAYSAGLEMEDWIAVEMYENSKGFPKSDMDDWHPGCDCKVVPVFDYREWPGKDEAAEALEKWNDATSEAIELIESGKSRSKNRNKEALNALRRRLQREAKKGPAARAA